MQSHNMALYFPFGFVAGLIFHIQSTAPTAGIIIIFGTVLFLPVSHTDIIAAIATIITDSAIFLNLFILLSLKNNSPNCLSGN